jgi:acyl carrier protein
MEEANKLISIVERETDLQGLTAESVITELGLNSLELLSLVCAVEDGMDITIPDEVIGEFETIGDYIKFAAENK